MNIVLENRDNHFVMQIEDNGNKKQGTSKQGQGLRNMKMRAERMGGNLDIETNQGYKLTLKMEKL